MPAACMGVYRVTLTLDGQEVWNDLHFGLHAEHAVSIAQKLARINGKTWDAYAVTAAEKDA